MVSLEYVKRVKAKLEETGKADRIPAFQKGATALVKHIIEKFDEIQIFAGENYDMEAGFGYCYQKEQDDPGPTFFFFHDGMKLEKFWIQSAYSTDLRKRLFTSVFQFPKNLKQTLCFLLSLLLVLII